MNVVLLCLVFTIPRIDFTKKSTFYVGIIHDEEFMENVIDCVMKNKFEVNCSKGKCRTVDGTR